MAICFIIGKFREYFLFRLASLSSISSYTIFFTLSSIAILANSINATIHKNFISKIPRVGFANARFKSFATRILWYIILMRINLIIFKLYYFINGIWWACTDGIERLVCLGWWKKSIDPSDRSFQGIDIKISLSYR